MTTRSPGNVVGQAGLERIKRLDGRRACVALVR
jgi:hypothetical protein